MKKFWRDFLIGYGIGMATSAAIITALLALPLDWGLL